MKKQRQPYQLRARDWIPFKGQEEYEQRVLYAYGLEKDIDSNTRYSYSTAYKKSPGASKRANILGVYNAFNVVGLLGLSAAGVCAMLSGIDALIN